MHVVIGLIANLIIGYFLVMDWRRGIAPSWFLIFAIYVSLLIIYSIRTFDHFWGI